MKTNVQLFAAWLCAIVYDDDKDHDMSTNARRHIAELNEEQQDHLTYEMSKLLGSSSDNTTPVSMVEYQAMKARMQNVYDMLWPVELCITVGTKELSISRVVSLQPDPKRDNWYYTRTPDWKVLHFHSKDELTSMPNLTFKTHMKEFFTLQRKLLKEQRRWNTRLDAEITWKQVMVQSILYGDGTEVSYCHESFSPHQKGLYHLEDERTRRVDYEWGKPADPMDAHRPGKLARKKLIEGELPIDVGRVTIGGERLTEEMMHKGKLDYVYYQLSEMVRWNEIKLLSVGLPDMFSCAKRMSGIFDQCFMPKDVCDKFGDRLGNNPYWKVKDKKRQRWYVYSYDWRTDRKKFTHSVIPIGHIEAYRKKPGEYYFTMYSEATLAERRHQSLYIADYRRWTISVGFCKWLGLKEELAGQELCFSVYNDWAAALWREFGDEEAEANRVKHSAIEALMAAEEVEERIAARRYDECIAD